MERILVIGANGQIGSELVGALAQKYGTDNVIAADIAACSSAGAPHYEILDVLDAARLAQVIEAQRISQVYQLAALLSVRGEDDPLRAWTLNMNGLLNILEIARQRQAAGKPLRVFWPSSIAAFGPHTPAVDTPQLTVMDPTTITASASRPASGFVNTILSNTALTCAASAIRESSAISRHLAAVRPTTRSPFSTPPVAAKPTVATSGRIARCR